MPSARLLKKSFGKLSYLPSAVIVTNHPLLAYPHVSPCYPHATPMLPPRYPHTPRYPHSTPIPHATPTLPPLYPHTPRYPHTPLYPHSTPIPHAATSTQVSRVDRRLSDKRRITDICITNKEGLASIEDNEAYEKLLESYRTVDEEAGGGVAFSPRAENARHSRQRAAHNERASRPEPHVSVGRRYEPPPTPVGRPGTAIGYVRPARAELTIRGGAPPAECPPLVVSGSTRDQVAAAAPTPATTPATHVCQRAHHQRALLYCAPLVGEHTHTEYISIASRMKTQADCGTPTPPTTTHAPPTRAEPTRDTPKHATSTRATMTHATAAYSAPTPATPPKQLAARKTTTAPAPLMPPTLPLRPPSPPAISTRSLCVEKPLVAEATPLTPAPPVARKETVAQASAREYAFNIPTGSTELLDASDCETTKEAAGGVANDDDLVYAAAGIVNSAITSATELLGGDLTPSRKGSGSGRPGEVEIRSVTFLTDSV